MRVYFNWNRFTPKLTLFLFIRLGFDYLVVLAKMIFSHFIRSILLVN